MDGIDDIEQITDPAERAREVGRRLDAIPAYQERLRAIRQTAVLQMKATGMSYADIGKALDGLHRNRVQQIAEGRSGSGSGSESALPPTIREVNDGQTAAKPRGRTWFEFTVDAPDDTVHDVLMRTGLDGKAQTTAAGERTRVRALARTAALRMHDSLMAAGCRIVDEKIST